MKTILKTFFTFLIFNFSAIAQDGSVGINTSIPDASAVLDIASINTGLLIPRMTQNERELIANPATGLLVYQINNSDGFWFFNGTTWEIIGGSGSGWGLTGNPGTNPGTNALGTIDNNDFVVRANSNEVIRFDNNGNIGINTTTPQAPLHITTGGLPPIHLQDGGQVTGRILSSNANGDATWTEPPSSVPGEDEDWLFASGSTLSDPIFHEGPVTIGVMQPTTRTLLVDSGDPVTVVKLGSVEDIFSRNNGLFFSTHVAPLIDNSIDFGSMDNRWTTIYTVNGVINTSDIRDKENIQDLDYGLEEVLKLKPVSFKWKEEFVDDFKIPNGQKRTHLGFIAQDIQEVIPDIIETSSWHEYEENPGVLEKKVSDIIGVNYSELIPILVKSIQEQEEQLIALEENNKKLKEAVKKHIKKK